VSLIITSAPAPSRAAKDATATVPIVFVTVADPIGMGLVTNLARPGGNVTGLATIEWEGFTAKTLEVAKEALPKSSRIAILMNPTNSMHTRVLAQAQAAADMLRLCRTRHAAVSIRVTDLGRAHQELHGHRHRR